MASGESEEVRADRLRRNRESAKRCRLKRKRKVSGMEDRLESVQHENSVLLRENQRLKSMLAQLQQGSQGADPLDDGFGTLNDGKPRLDDGKIGGALFAQDCSSPDHDDNSLDNSMPRGTPAKKTRYELGVTNSFDSSESAAFANSQQKENTPLAMVTTALYMTIAALHTAQTTQGTQVSTPATAAPGATTPSPSASLTTENKCQENGTQCVEPGTAGTTCLTSLPTAPTTSSWTCPSSWTTNGDREDGNGGGRPGDARKETGGACQAQLLATKPISSTILQPQIA